MHKTIRENIRELRKQQGLTQQQMADYLHIDRSSYAYYESGRTDIKVKLLVTLAQFFQVSYATIIGQPDPVPPNGTEPAAPND